MPIYVYRCKDCGTKFEVLHKAKEKEEDNICPSCKSINAVKVMAAASISVGGAHSHAGKSELPPCGMPGGCGSGMCGLG